MREVIVLRCLVYGESTKNIFRVRIGEDDEVSDLKDAIKAKKQNAFANVDADKLTLWRVSIPLDDNADATLANLKLESSDEKGIKELRPSDGISRVFHQDLGKRHIHVIIQPPVTG